MEDALSPLTKKLSAFLPLGDSDLIRLSTLEKRKRMFPPGHEFVFEGQVRSSAFVVSSGWSFSYKMLSDGARQIVNIQIPGDFVGLRSILLRTSDHSVEALTNVDATEILASDIFDVFSDAPKLASAVLWALSRDEAMVVEHLVSVGRRPADQRVAHFMLELGARLKLIGAGGKSGFDCPLTQYHLADILGLTAIHVNRVLRRLREARLIVFKNGVVRIMDFDRLASMCGFGSEYLDQGKSLLR